MSKPLPKEEGEPPPKPSAEQDKHWEDAEVGGMLVGEVYEGDEKAS